MIQRSLILTAMMLLTVTTTGCGRSEDDGPVDVSVIGGPLRLVDPNDTPLDAAAAIMLGATAQGLVRFNAAGQIEPALAIRWAISEDGLYYTFRLGEFAGIDADFVTRRLRAAIARRSENPLKPILGAIDEIVAVTPEVVEIRLKAARPNLLDLLAQPELAVFDKKRRTGPLEIVSQHPHMMVLQPIRVAEAVEDPPSPRERIVLRGARAGVAVASFVAGRSNLVLGGRFSDYSVARAANLRARDIAVDPVTGLFGLAVVDRAGLLADSENRRALAMALDRDRIITAFGIAGWQQATALVAAGTIELPQPALPGWGDRDIGTRRSLAAETVRVWKLANPDTAARVRIALPEGPGSRLLFALLRSDWAAIGIEAQRVPENADADLRLIDEVAPNQSATWYLRHFECSRSVMCSEAADMALDIARTTPDPVDRAARIADADLRLAELVPFIPIAQPLRWSLASQRLPGFRTNNRGVHPLNHLIDNPR